MKKSIGQAKQVTKEQKRKISHSCTLSFRCQTKARRMMFLPCLWSVRWAFVVQLTDNEQKPKLCVLSGLEVNIQKQIKGSSQERNGGRLFGVLGQHKHIPLGSLAWIMFGVWRFEVWEFGGEFKASPFWVSSSFSSSYFVSTYDSLLILVL